jgi:hypothetical protein
VRRVEIATFEPVQGTFSAPPMGVAARREPGSTCDAWPCGIDPARMFCFCSGMSFPHYLHPTLVDLRIPPREKGEHRRPHRNTPHNISTVARVKKMVETTTLPHRTIASVAHVTAGTVSRWTAKHGWSRPEGAAKPRPHTETRYVPNLIGRVLATRLRLQAERLLHDLEAAPAVDPAVLDLALTLLARARAEQNVRRGKRRVPPTLTPEQEAKRNRRKGHDRSTAAERGWRKRYRSKEYQDWLREKVE